jgi:transcriptional regulator with XRE-family HTH domain
MTTDAETIGRRIRRYRQSRGWTQKELAAKTGVHLNQVHAWEKGLHVPAVQRRPRIAGAFGVQPEILFAVGAERSEALEDLATDVMLSVARAPDASPTQRLSAARGLKSKAESAKTYDDAMADFRAMMEKADEELTEILKECELEENS